MQHLVLTHRASNPFATRFVRPGSVPYQFPTGVDAHKLVEKLQNNRWRGAIIGPHGSGKSTLLATLIPTIEQMSGCSIRSIALHNGQRRLPKKFSNQLQLHALTIDSPFPIPHSPFDRLNRKRGAKWTPQVIVVDGYEQLSWRSRWRLAVHCRRSGCGLLITAHHDASASRFPILFRTEPNLAVVQAIAVRLLAGNVHSISSDDIAAAYYAQGGNVRETLFSLYDLFEKRRKKLV